MVQLMRRHLTGLRIFEKTGQMAWVDKNGDGRIQHFGRASRKRALTVFFRVRGQPIPDLDAAGSADWCSWSALAGKQGR